MEQKKITTQEEPLYTLFKNLYTHSFPLFEQRTEEQQQRAFEHPRYHLTAFCQDEQFVGFIAHWDFDLYLYIEHFAIDTQLRGCGYGSQILNRFTSQAHRPVLLEIDPVVDPVSQARLRFYTRSGFVENPYPHTHPPYRAEFNPHRLIVLSTHGPLCASLYDRFHQELTHVVMNMEREKKTECGIQTEDWGVIDYSTAWKQQTEGFNHIIARKQAGKPTADRLILCQHPPVITLGKRAHRENVLLDKENLKREGFDLYEIDRGGDVTYHGPGQLVVYPLFDLEHYGVGLKEYVWRLEEAVIGLLALYGVEGERLAGATGVWLDIKKPEQTRKICAIGVRSSRYVTMHGLALNVNTNLQHFSVINPCGFVDKGVTSLQQELGQNIDIEQVKKQLIKEFFTLFATPCKGV